MLILLLTLAHAEPLIGGGLGVVASGGLGAGPAPHLEFGWSLNERHTALLGLGYSAAFRSGNINASAYPDGVDWRATEQLLSAELRWEWRILPPDQPLQPVLGAAVSGGALFTAVTPSVSEQELHTTRDGAAVWGALGSIGLTGEVGPGQLLGRIDAGILHTRSPLTGFAWPVVITPTLCYRVPL